MAAAIQIMFNFCIDRFKKFLLYLTTRGAIAFTLFRNTTILLNSVQLRLSHYTLRQDVIGRSKMAGLGGLY